MSSYDKDQKAIEDYLESSNSLVLDESISLQLGTTSALVSRIAADDVDRQAFIALLLEFYKKSNKDTQVLLMNVFKYIVLETPYYLQQIPFNHIEHSKANQLFYLGTPLFALTAALCISFAVAGIIGALPVITLPAAVILLAIAFITSVYTIIGSVLYAQCHDLIKANDGLKLPSLEKNKDIKDQGETKVAISTFFKDWEKLPVPESSYCSALGKSAMMPHLYLAKDM